MGMMDGGLNFRDICSICKCNKNGGSMRRYIKDRNKKICDDCYEEQEDKSNYLYARDLKNL